MKSKRWHFFVNFNFFFNCYEIILFAQNLCRFSFATVFVCCTSLLVVVIIELAFDFRRRWGSSVLQTIAHVAGLLCLRLGAFVQLP